MLSYGTATELNLLERRAGREAMAGPSDRPATIERAL
jgi:hypothetical protein